MKVTAVDKRVLRQAVRLGMLGNLEGRIMRMARLSAPLTHPKANRRYEKYMLTVDPNGVVTAIALYVPDPKAVSKPPRVFRHFEADDEPRALAPTRASRASYAQEYAARNRRK